jgi:hypothetical protein
VPQLRREPGLFVKCAFQVAGFGFRVVEKETASSRLIQFCQRWVGEEREPELRKRLRLFGFSMMNNDGLDLLVDGFKFAGVAIAAATGFLGFFATKTWEEYKTDSRILARGHGPQTKRRLTRFGKWTLFFLLCGSLVAIGAQVVDTVRTKKKEKREADDKNEERARVAQEKQRDEDQFAREKQRDREEFDRKLREQRQQYEANTAEFIFQKNDLERQRVQLIEIARSAHLDIKLPAPEAIPSTNIDQAIESALKTIPVEVKAAAAQRNQAEVERIAAQVKARELDKLIRPRVIYVFDLIRTVVAHAQQKGLITVTNLGPAPALPERLVYSQQETNINLLGARAGENILRTNIQQRVEFAHGDAWTAYLVVGSVQSATTTTEHLYPKVRIKSNAGLNATIWFDPVSAELQITPQTTYSLSDGVLKSENAIVTNLVEFLKQSRLRSSRQ